MHVTETREGHQSVLIPHRVDISHAQRGSELRKIAVYLMSLPRLFYLLCFVVLVITLFWGGSQSYAVGLFPPPFDKLAHSVYFATLALLLWFGTGGRWPVMLVVVVSAIGGLDELHQSTLPGRVADFYDYLVDTLAAGAAIAVLEWNKQVIYALRHDTR